MKNLIWLFAFFTLSLLAVPALADQQSFVVLPFSVNAPKSYSYLGKAIPGTIQSKLTKPGVLQGKTAGGAASSSQEARKALQAANADYAIWGVVNVVGNDCSVEVNSVDKNGKTWSKSANGKVANLTGTVQNLASALGKEALGVSVAAQPVFMTPGNRPAQKTSAPNSDIVMNETGQQNVYLNPQFRYQGSGTGDGSRIKTQRIDHNMVDMAVGDFNGDGKNEIAVLGDTTLSIYIWEEGGKLKSLGEKKVSGSNNNFSMRAMDLNRDGAKDLIIATYESESNRPYSYFISFKGNQFSEAAPRIPYFASVMKLPPTFAPTLVGQGFDSIKLFAPGVHQLIKQGGKYVLGGRIGLPEGANVFNTAFVPADKNAGGDLIIMLSEDERIKVYQGRNDKYIHRTMERFSGSATGMDHYKAMPGLAIDKTSQLPGKYYAPMRMIAADIGNTGENVLLLNKPISTASEFFDRYRFFPQGEIHALYWDGVGMGLKWKTRRIKGSVAEIDLGDVNNDGIMDLVVGINTSPDLGIGSRQSLITAYPLDVTKTNPNTPADMSDFEVTPNR